MDIDNILIMPYVTEKTQYLNQKSKTGQIIVFKVHPKANKTMIKNAIKNMYNLRVLDVKIINQPYRKARFKNKILRSPGFKKAIIKLEPGQTIKFDE